MVAKIPADDAAAATAQNYFLERTKVFFPLGAGELGFEELRQAERKGRECE